MAGPPGEFSGEGGGTMDNFLWIGKSVGYQRFGKPKWTKNGQNLLFVSTTK